MEITELTLSNFRRFASQRFDFIPGLNLVWGPNESGKSTVYESLCCALFGRERGGSYESWAGGSPSVGLAYTSDGQAYRVVRQLTAGTSRFGVTNGDDLSDITTSKDEIAERITAHLGLSSRSVFENTVSVRQTNLSAPAGAELESVGAEIQRVLTGTAHLSADQARKDLEGKRDAIKGRARPTKPREYDRISDRLTKLASEVADARASRDQLRNLEEEESTLQARVDQDSARLTVVEGLLEKYKRWAELKQKNDQLNAQHEASFSTLREIRQTEEDLALVQKELEEHTDLVGKDEEIQEHLAKIAWRREELQSQLADVGFPDKVEHAAIGKGKWFANAVALVMLIIIAVAGGKGWVNPILLGAIAVVVLVALVWRFWRFGARNSGGRKMADLADSFYEDLVELDKEEQSILSYVKCPDAGRAVAKIKNYQTLAGRAREFEASLKGLLAGRKREDMEAQEAELARELSGIRRELDDDFRDYSPTTEESESWRSEVAALQNSVPSAENRLSQVLGSLSSERSHAKDMAALEGELEFLHRRRAELEFTYKAYEEAISAVATVTDAVSREYLPELSERATNYLKQLTSGRYSAVTVNPGWDVSADCREKTAVRSALLSQGTLDQLYLALRLGCGELLSAGKRLPVVLDDPFPAFDRVRLDNALELLKQAARSNQVILMTHDPHILDWAKSLQAAGQDRCAIHELASPQL